MYKEEYEMLRNIDKQTNIIQAKDMMNTLDRTLLYGYTIDRDTFHVYLENGEIFVVLYSWNPTEIRQIKPKTNHEYVPDKRLYPERCDYEFCRLLKSKGIELPFTSWTDGIEKQIYYGEILGV